MKINSVAILGLGAVGSYVLWGLSEKPDIELSVIAKGDRKLRYEKEGFVINGKKYHPMIKTPEEASGVDLLVVATKYNSLKSALPIMSSPKSLNFRLFFKFLPRKTEQKMYDSHCILY